MANLTRYKLKVRWHGDKDGFVAEGAVRECGEWVKFADIKDLLQTSPNSDYAKCFDDVPGFIDWLVDHHDTELYRQLMRHFA